MAYNEAMKAKNQTEKAKLMLQNVLSDVQDFLGLGRATPDDVKEVIIIVLFYVFFSDLFQTGNEFKLIWYKGKYE